MLIALSCAAAVSAALAIAADWDERRHKSFYLLKPLTTLLIAGAAASASPAFPAYQQWVLLALTLSLSGDVCLMFKGSRWFMAGLASFLLAHLAFVAAFLQNVTMAALPAWLAAVVVYAGGLLFVLLPRTGPLKLPVLIYCLVLAAMVFTAAARHEVLDSARTSLALGGALLFMLSDSLLGVRQFVRRYAFAQPLILSTYWLAIGLIAWSV
jgi:uncharacterized membrane protein YhhN